LFSQRGNRGLKSALANTALGKEGNGNIALDYPRWRIGVSDACRTDARKTTGNSRRDSNGHWYL
jgi:hypothetical protein